MARCNNHMSIACMSEVSLRKPRSSKTGRGGDAAEEAGTACISDALLFCHSSYTLVRRCSLAMRLKFSVWTSPQEIQTPLQPPPALESPCDPRPGLRSPGLELLSEALPRAWALPPVCVLLPKVGGKWKNHAICAPSWLLCGSCPGAKKSPQGPRPTRVSMSPP